MRAGEVKIIIYKCNGKLTKMLENVKKKQNYAARKKKSLPLRFLLTKVNNKCRYHAVD